MGARCQERWDALPVSELVTLDIESIAAGGDGIARHDGLVVFVPRTAPGDRVQVRIERGRRFARGRVERIKRPSDQRAEPRCPHYTRDRCGGCQLQHMSLAAQRVARQRIVSDNIRRIGRRDVALPTMHAAGDAWRYRQRVSLALRHGPDGWKGGFHRCDGDDIFPLEDCWIAREDVMALWRDVLRGSVDLLPPGAALRLTVGAADGRGSVVVEGGAAWPGATRFAASLPESVAAWWVPEGGRRRRVRAGVEGSPDASFSQVNPPVGHALLQYVEATVKAAGAKRVVDAYSGTGALAAALHVSGVAVAAIELDAEASAHAAARLGRPSRAIAARVEDVIEEVLPADVVVVNPPRGGLHARVSAAIERAARDVSALVYVSCDPATLARDLARLPSWEVDTLDSFDMFPQTAHVETVAVLRAGSAS